jgi:hypothetical protein
MEDLMALVEKTRSELSLLKPEPPIYTLSSLFNLFRSSEKSISEKDALRLAQWETEEELVTLSNKETSRFNAVFQDKLSRERYTLLLKNNMERLGMISIGLKNWSRIHQDILSRDAKSVEGVIRKLEYHHQQIEQIRTLVRSTLDGSSAKIKGELKQDVDRFFDARYGSVMQNIREYIRGYQVDFKAYEELMNASSFMDILFLIYQDFKAALDSYMAEVVNPRIVKFIREEEAKANTDLAAVGEPYEAMIAEAISGYRETMDRLGIPLLKMENFERATKKFDLKDSGRDFKIPSVETAMRYSARIKTEAVVRFGFYSIAKIINKILKKEEDGQGRQRINALRNSVKQIKRETERSVALHFKDYQENIKFQYIFKITDTMADQLYEALLEQFRSYTVNVSTVIEQIKERHVDKESIGKLLKRVEAQSATFAGDIEGLNERVESVFGEAKERISNNESRLRREMSNVRG